MHCLDILAQDSGLLVINKQFGQRMDGDYEGTVEKLVLQLPGVEKFRPIHQVCIRNTHRESQNV